MLIAAFMVMWILRVALYLLTLVLAFASACIAGWIGRNRRIGFVTAFLIGLILPVVGIAAALLSQRVDEES